MTNDLIELAGLFVLVVGACLLVAAAALVSTALALAVAGGLCVFSGVVAVYVANARAVSPPADLKRAA